MLVEPIERIRLSEIQDVDRRFAFNSKPVVISGAALEWPAMSALTPEALKNNFGEVDIPVRRSDDELAEFFGPRQDTPRPRIMMRLREYIEIAETTSRSEPRPPFAGNIDILHDPAVAKQLSEVLASCPFPDWMPAESTSAYRLWIGAAGQRSTIHNDAYHNFNAQIVGRKRFILFAPTQHDAMYPVFLNSGCWASPIDPNKPDLGKYPKYERAEGFECELSAGDVLYLPRFWWHYADATTVCVNVNRWVVTQTNPFWHQQSEARRFIAYGALLEHVRQQFRSLPAELQEVRRPSFTQLEDELIRSTHESSESARQ